MLKAFFIVLVLASGLRFTALTFDSLWLDEGYQTVVESYGNNIPNLFNPEHKSFIYKPESPARVENVLKNFRKVDPLCPPLFAVIMNRWLTVFGGTDFAIRSFAALCSVLSIIAIYFYGSTLLGKNVGLYAALIQAISPFDICYAQEARMYSLSMLLAILSGGSLLYLIQKKHSYKHLLFALIYAVSTSALINTHYTQLFFWAFTIFIGMTSTILRKDWRILGLIVISNFLIIALSAPGIPMFLQAASLRSESFYVARQPTLWWPFFALFIRIPFNWIGFLSGKKVMVWAYPVYLTSFLIISSALVPLVRRLKGISNHHTNKLVSGTIIFNYPITLIMLWAIVPALMIWLLDVKESHKVITILRYSIATAPAIMLLSGYSLSILRRKNYFLPLIICHTLFCLTNNAYLHLVFQKEPWREMAQTVEARCQPNELIFICNYYNLLCLDRYLNKPMRQIGISAASGAATITQNLKKEQSDLNPNSKFWILSAQEGDAVYASLPSQFKVEQKFDFPHALQLRQYSVSPSKKLNFE